MKYAPPFHPPSTLTPTPGTVCYDCNRSASGHCWRHQMVTIVPTIIRPSHTFSPYEHDRTGMSADPVNGDLTTETGPLPHDFRWP